MQLPVIPAFDQASALAMQKIMDSKTKPLGSLGQIEALACQLAGITRSLQPVFSTRAVLVAAADHGITAQGVSLYPSEVTRQMVLNFMSGGAAVNVLARSAGAEVVVVDAGVRGERLPASPGFFDCRVAEGTADFSKQPAMTQDQAQACLQAGFEVVRQLYKDGVRLLAVGEMGIGNTSASSAITAAALKLPADQVTGRGTGLDVEAWKRKVAVLEQSLQLHQPKADDGMDLLSKVGGFEIGLLAGAMLQAAALRMPIMLDGFISGAAALIAVRLDPACKDYLIAGHQSVEVGHRHLLGNLGLKPLLQLDLRLGEGTGGAMALHFVDAACAIVREMATFESAQVSDQKTGEDAFEHRQG
jgi:nicotinate-nucleotide--dimethylbenzimidazole phosphoribosyltransferase